jgi:hypothetical protein
MTKALRTGTMEAVMAATMLRSVLSRPKSRSTRNARSTCRRRRRRRVSAKTPERPQHHRHHHHHRRRPPPPTSTSPAPAKERRLRRRTERMTPHRRRRRRRPAADVTAGTAWQCFFRQSESEPRAPHAPSDGARGRGQRVPVGFVCPQRWPFSSMASTMAVPEYGCFRRPRLGLAPGRAGEATRPP